MSCFKDYYLFPLETDHYGSYIWDAKHNMAAMYSWLKEYDDEFLDNMSDILNGVADRNSNEWVKNHLFKYDDNEGLIMALNLDGSVFDEEFIIIRGWGRLTSPNCCGLSPEKAKEVQDEFGLYILNRLNGDK